MIIAFRADASLSIGSGHIMRSLTLARELTLRGHSCIFICRDLPGAMIKEVAAEFPLVVLPASDVPPPKGPPDHAAWAEVGWEQDAAETLAAITKADWFVVDHYAFDAHWQRKVRFEGSRVMVLDDLADRPHACDLLLDQNLGRSLCDYDGLVPNGCIRLVGPRFALLRTEFKERRARALLARGGRELRHVLITMGGIDQQGVTARILASLRSAKLPQNTHITVIMGSRAPALDRVRAQAATMPWPTTVMVDVRDMATWMEAADLAIGAGGSTSWERCALGLPSIVLKIAENQAGIVKALVDANAALYPGPIAAPDFTLRLHETLSKASTQLDRLAHKSALICDGNGVARVVAALESAT